MKKFKIDTTDQVNTSNENETTSSDNATQPNNESDEPSIKTSEIPQDLSALGKPRRVAAKNYTHFFIRITFLGLGSDSYFLEPSKLRSRLRINS